MKAKLLSFIFINFSESGLFKMLRPKKIKKSSAVQLASRVARQRSRTDIDAIAPFPQSSRIWPPDRRRGAASSTFQRSFRDALAETGNFPDSVFVSGKDSVEFRNQQDNVDFSAIAAFRQDVKPSAPSRRVCRGARR
jgi:hypothetical protein